MFKQTYLIYRSYHNMCSTSYDTIYESNYLDMICGSIYQRGLGNNNNEVMRHTPQFSRTGTSPSNAI